MAGGPEPVSLQDIIWFAGMGIGAAIAGVMVRLGLKAGGKPDVKDMVITGQSAITDMAPLRELVKQVDLLTLQLQAATASVDSMVGAQVESNQIVGALVEKQGALIEQIGEYLSDLRRRESENNLQRLIDETVNDRLKTLEEKNEPAPARRRT